MGADAFCSADVDAFGSADVTLNEIQTTINWTLGQIPTATVAGSLTVDGLAFDVEGTIDQGLKLAGQMAGDTAYTVKSLLEKLPGVGSITLPNQVPDFKLSTIAVSVSTRDMSASISGKIEKQGGLFLKLPGMDALDVPVTFSAETSLDGDKRHYVGTLSGPLKLGQTFDVTYTCGDDVQIVTGSWKKTGKSISASTTWHRHSTSTGRH